MTNEVWRPVTGYEGQYEVSACGNVRSIARTIQTKRGPRKLAGKLLRPKPNDAGYLRVPLFSDGRRKNKLVHRLVADAFCVHPEGCEVVNHLDNTPGNNRADNLEWTTPRGNVHHSIRQQRNYTRAVVRGDGKVYSKLSQVEEDGFHAPGVCRACRGQLKTYRGLEWWYAEEGGRPNAGL